MPVGEYALRVGSAAMLCIAATLLPIRPAPVAATLPVRLAPVAATAREPDVVPTAAKLAPTDPYRLGYTSSDIPRLAAVDAGSGSPVASPTGEARAEEPSTCPDAVVFVTHRSGHVDTDLSYQLAGAPAARLLTGDDATDRHPVLSPDGKWVAFESDRGGQIDIWVINVDGSGLRQITTDTTVAAEDTWPAWSPTGDRIAFSSTRDGPAGDIYVVPTTGGATIRLTENLAADTQPAWSPVGGTIAFTTTRFQSPEKAGTDIAAVPDGGGVVRRLHRGEQAAWSPDGTRLAYVIRDADPSGDIAVRTAATGAVRVVAGTPARAETHPTWQGSVVVYTDVGDGGPDTDIWSADANGQDRRDHTNRPELSEDGPAFSPDGLHLAYAEHDVNLRSRITIADADGRNPRPLTNFAPRVSDRDPTWSPDGTKIAFARVTKGDQVAEGEASTIQLARVADGKILGAVPMPRYLRGDDSEPAWAPDGSHLAFTREATLWPPGPVAPGAVDRPVNPGGSTTVEQVVRTPAIPPNPDIVLLIDTTGSMDPTLDNVKANVKKVVDSVREAQPTAHFAVASYRDVIDGPEQVFQVWQGLTDERDLVQAAVDKLSAEGGGDTPEDWIYALHQVAQTKPDSLIRYRAGGSRIVVLVGDASSHDPSNGISIGTAIDHLKAAGIRAVAVAVGDQPPGGLDSTGQATRVTEATGGTLVDAPTAADVTAAILSGVHNLDVTVTPTATDCDPGLKVTFDPASITVPGGTDVHVRQTATVADNAQPGAILRCTIDYRLSPNPGGKGYRVPLTIRVHDPRLPLVIVDDVTVPATGPEGAVVTYQATATDARGRPLTPTCRPRSGSTFPIGQTTVTCTATDSSSRVGRDTAHVNVVSGADTGPSRIWVATLEFPTGSDVDVTAQVDLSAKVGAPCAARTQDGAPAWSPDSKLLAFVASDVLCVVAADGSQARTPVVPQPARSGVAADPAWSPDGALVAYGWVETSEELPTNTSIWTVPRNGGAPTEVIDTPGYVSQPAYQRVSRQPPPPPLPSPGLQLSVSAAPQPGYVGGTPIGVAFTVRNPNTYPVRQVTLVVQVPAELSTPIPARLLGTLPGGGTATVTVPLPPTRAVTSVVRGQVTGLYAEDRLSSARARTPVIVRQPVLRVDPGVGPPGFVTLAAGSDFPPGATVTLTWSQGISALTQAKVTTDGTFEAQMLVFHHDILGERQLVASGVGFGPVQRTFLVVAATLEPRGFVQRR